MLQAIYIGFLFATLYGALSFVLAGVRELRRATRRDPIADLIWQGVKNRKHDEAAERREREMGWMSYSEKDE